MTHDTALTILGQRSSPARSAAEVLAPLPGPGNPGYRAIRSLYIHVPFCFHKCHYCDFYSFVDTRDRQGVFVERLIRELRALSVWSSGEPLETVFVGGGTPSLLAPELWAELLAALGEAFDLSEIRAGRGEFTVECNPETVTPALMGTLASGGVDRVSIGAQSFEPRHLETLERWHDPDNVARAVELARDAGIARVSVDLIHAIPGQTIEDLDRDLVRAIGLGVGHLSCYALTYEPNTPLTKRLARGEFEPADEDLEVEMYRLLVERARRAGLDRYEVSNFAHAGQQSAHNLAYWRQTDWLAAGPSASGHASGNRWKNVPSLRRYLAEDDEGYAPIQDHEPPDTARALAERIMTGLRLTEGLDAESVVGEAAALGEPAREELDRAVQRSVRRGYLDDAHGRWALTDEGFLFADGIASELMAAIANSGR